MDRQISEMKDSIDALGYRPDRHHAFTKGLLAEAEDEILQSIVEEAAQNLSTPIALVNLVLEEIQFFKAHYGLPLPLATARGTERDVSFCQFVVRDGETFVVTNAKEDPRVPQHLVKDFGIQSYLGIPVEVENVIVGSLCVIDTQPREFSEEDHQLLRTLAERVNTRIAEINQGQRITHAFMLDDVAAPALSELGEILSAIQTGAMAGPLTTAALASFFRLAARAISGQSIPPEHLKRNLKAAQVALDNCENYFYNIEANAGDAEDIRGALEQGMIQSSATRLSEVSIAGWELARRNTAQIGGATWPDLAHNPIIATPRPLAVVLISTCLSTIAGRMIDLNTRGGISMEAEDFGVQVGLRIGTNKLPLEVFQDIKSELDLLTRDNPSLAVQATSDAIRLLFLVGNTKE